MCFSLLYGVSTGGFGFPDGCVADGLGFLNRFSCFGLVWWILMPSSQTNFRQQMSMDDLVANSSPRALLASFGDVSIFGGSAAVGPCCPGYGQGGSRDFLQGGFPHLSIIWVFTWEDVSPGPERSPNLGVEAWVQPQDLVPLGLSSLTCVQMCLILPVIEVSSLPLSCWPFLPPLVEEPWQDLALGWGKSDCCGAVLWVLVPLGWAAGCLPLDKWFHFQSGLYPWPVIRVARLSHGLHAHSVPWGRWPASLSLRVDRPLAGWFTCGWCYWCLLLSGYPSAPPWGVMRQYSQWKASGKWIPKGCQTRHPGVSSGEEMTWMWIEPQRLFE